MLRGRVLAIIIIIAVAYTQVVKSCSGSGVGVVDSPAVAVVTWVVSAAIVPVAVGVVVAVVGLVIVGVCRSSFPSVVLVLVMPLEPACRHCVWKVVGNE